MLKKLLVCTNYRANPNQPSCGGRSSKQIFANLQQKILFKNHPIDVEESPCMGFCNVGPNARLVPNGDFIHEISADNLSAVLKAAKKFSKLNLV